MKWIVVFGFLLCRYPCFAYVDWAESTVRIYAHMDNQSVNQGTGFIVKINDVNYIATCYHVIYNCRLLEGFSIKVGGITGLQIAGYDETKDLAILKASNISDVRALTVSDVSLAPNLSALAIGNPNSTVEQEFSVQFTARTGTISTSQFFDVNGRQVFDPSIDFRIIPFTISSIYGGMSGAPIIVNNQVVGVISGSLNMGGSLCWAIPSDYLLSISLDKHLNNGLGLHMAHMLNNKLYRSLEYNETEILQYKPVEDLFADLTTYQKQLISLSAKTTTLLEEMLSNLNAIKEHDGYADDKAHSDFFRNNNDLIQLDLKLVMAANDFFNSKNTLDQISTKITEDLSSAEKKQELDLDLCQRHVDKLSKLSSLEEIALTKYQNKVSESQSARNWVPTVIIGNSTDLVTGHWDSWFNYLTLHRQEISSLKELVNVQYSKYKELKILDDFAIEAMGYTEL